MSFGDIVFDIAVGVSGGDFIIPLIFLGIGLTVLMAAVRFPLGAGFFVAFVFSFALFAYFNVHQAITSFWIFLLLIVGASLAVFVLHLFRV